MPVCLNEGGKLPSRKLLLHFRYVMARTGVVRGAQTSTHYWIPKLFLPPTPVLMSWDDDPDCLYQYLRASNRASIATTIQYRALVPVTECTWLKYPVTLRVWTNCPLILSSAYLCCIKCRYSTCCSKAMSVHVSIFHGTKNPTPVFELGEPCIQAKDMFCCCGFYTKSGNKMGTPCTSLWNPPSPGGRFSLPDRPTLTSTVGTFFYFQRNTLPRMAASRRTQTPRVLRMRRGRSLRRRSPRLSHWRRKMGRSSPSTQTSSWPKHTQRRRTARSTKDTSRRRGPWPSWALPGRTTKRKTI